MSDNWFYARGSTKSGPMRLEELRQRLAAEGNPGDALVWRAGFESWRRVATVADLAFAPVTPPPLPIMVADSTEQREIRVAEKKSGARTALEWATWGVSGLGGFVLVKIFGAILYWPAGLIGLAWFVLAKCKVDKVIIPMLAIVLGHTGWMIVGHSILLWVGRTTDDTWWFSVDLICVLVITIWMLRKKSVASAGALLCYQMLALGFGILETIDKTIGLAQSMHIILRLAGIAAAVYGILALQKLRKAQAIE